MSSELQSIVAELQFGNYLSVVIVTAITYDYIITVPNEIRYIWNRPWTFVSYLFVLVRYAGFSVAFIQGLYGSTFIPGPTLVSTVILLVSDWAFIAFLAAADIVMILRIYAMYNKSRILLCVLLFLCAATIIIYAISTTLYNDPNTHLIMTNPQVLNMSFCNPTYNASVTVKLARYRRVPRLTLAALLLILTITRFCVESFQMYKATNQWKASQYLHLLVSEGVLYFFVHLLNNINFGDGVAGSVMTMVVFILVFVLSPRFVMNVRELYLHKLLHGNVWNKGIDSGFGLSSQSSQVQVVSLVDFPDLRIPDMEEADVEMREIGESDSNP